jgi:hypothetical protein
MSSVVIANGLFDFDRGGGVVRSIFWAGPMRLFCAGAVYHRELKQTLFILSP